LTERQSIIRNFQWLAGVNIAVKPLWLFFLFYSVRLLGPVEFGNYMLAISYVSVIYSVLEGGIDIFTVRELSSGRREYQKLFPHTIFLKISTAFFTFCLAAVLSYNFLTISAPKIIIIYGGVYIFAYSLITHARYVFRSYEVLKYEALSILIEKILVVGLCFLALSFNKSALIFMVAFAIGYLLTSLVTIYFLFRKIGIPKLRIEMSYLLRQVMIPALPYAILTFLMVVYSRSATIMIKILTGEESLVGYYNAGYRIVEAFVLFPSLVIGPLYPVFVRMNHDKKYICQLTLKAIRIITVVSLSICALFMLLRENITIFIYGSKYLLATNLIGLLTITMIPIGVTWVFGTLVAATGRQSRANVFIIFITIGNIFGHFYFISNFGLMGAVIVTIITESAIALVNLWIMKDYLTIEMLLLLLKFSIVPLILYLISLMKVISGPFIIQLTIIILLLIGMFLILRLITLNDIQRVLSSGS